MHLIAALLEDPESLLFAEKAEMKYPMSREQMVLMDLYDITVAANTDKNKRFTYPRPFKTEKEKREHIAKFALPVDEARKVLEFMNPARKKSTETSPDSLTLKKEDLNG